MDDLVVAGVSLEQAVAHTAQANGINDFSLDADASKTNSLGRFRLFERFGQGSISQNIGRAEALNTSGIDDLGKVLTNAVSAGLNNSKAVDVMVSSLSSLAQNSAGAKAGIDMGTVSQDILNRATNPNIKNEIQRMNVAKASSEVDILKTDSMSFSEMQQRVGMLKLFNGDPLAEANFAAMDEPIKQAFLDATSNDDPIMKFVQNTTGQMVNMDTAKGAKKYMEQKQRHGGSNMFATGTYGKPFTEEEQKTYQNMVKEGINLSDAKPEEQIRYGQFLAVSTADFNSMGGGIDPNAVNRLNLNLKRDAKELPKPGLGAEQTEETIGVRESFNAKLLSEDIEGGKSYIQDGYNQASESSKYTIKELEEAQFELIMSVGLSATAFEKAATQINQAALTFEKAGLSFGNIPTQNQNQYPAPAQNQYPAQYPSSLPVEYQTNAEEVLVDFAKKVDKDLGMNQSRIKRGSNKGGNLVPNPNQ
jgi:hypothetical protein